MIESRDSKGWGSNLVAIDYGPILLSHQLFARLFVTV
jgi:hypothetical protein